MGSLLKFGVLALLIYLGWRKPFRDHANELLPWAEVTPSRIATQQAEAVQAAQVPVSAPPQRDSTWMWGPTSLDPKKKGSR